MKIVRINNSNEEEIFEGKEVFSEINNQISKVIRNAIADPKTPKLDDVVQIYLRYYGFQSIQLSYYFRNLYQIIKFIDESTIDNKKRYSNFIRAQFSPDEINLLLLNCLSHLGKEKFKPLVIEYSLLKHIEDLKLQNKAIAQKWYPLKAFDK